MLSHLRREYRGGAALIFSPCDSRQRQGFLPFAPPVSGTDNLATVSIGLSAEYPDGYRHRFGRRNDLQKGHTTRLRGVAY